MNFGIAAAYGPSGSWRSPKTLKKRRPIVLHTVQAGRTTGRRSRCRPWSRRTAKAEGRCSPPASAIPWNRRRHWNWRHRRSGSTPSIRAASKHVEEARQVGGVRGQRILDGTRHGTQRRQVDHDIHTFHGFGAFHSRTDIAYARTMNSGRPSKCAMLSCLLVAKLSMHRTEWPAAIKASHTWLPMKPAPPVTRMVTRSVGAHVMVYEGKSE